jgi:hypothetical protein
VSSAIAFEAKEAESNMAAAKAKNLVFIVVSEFIALYKL